MKKSEKTGISRAGVLGLAAMIGLLLASGYYAFHIWTSIETEMSGWGWGMLVLGVVITTLVGAGLMALVFYSARHDMDR
jgi:hypothetical protein